MHTLKDILASYDWDKLTITISEHTIEVDADKNGSWFVVRNFYQEKFAVKYFDKCNKHLYVTT